MPTGSINPMQVHLPGIFVDRIVKATTPRDIEFETLRSDETPGTSPGAEADPGKSKREIIARVRTVQTC